MITGINLFEDGYFVPRVAVASTKTLASSLGVTRDSERHAVPCKPDGQQAGRVLGAGGD
jgi:hypothetical protein